MKYLVFSEQYSDVFITSVCFWNIRHQVRGCCSCSCVYAGRGRKLVAVISHINCSCHTPFRKNIPTPSYMVSNGWFRSEGELSYLSKTLWKSQIYGEWKREYFSKSFSIIKLLIILLKHFPKSFLVNLTRALTRIRRCFAHLQIPRELSYSILHQF